MLLQHILSKHVVIIMSNGHVARGFVHSEEDGYLKLIRTDNREAIIKVTDISVAEIAAENQMADYQALDRQYVQSDNDFSMVASPIESDSTYASQTEFVRQTPRGRE